MARVAPVTPLDREHTFGVDELFFSTTDRKGIIELANSTFVKLSHYTHDELVGAPHNIIRHPDMPGGAFKLVWDQVAAGRPACAYVKNLAKDGGLYWVFATLLPVGDKLLSVRKRPLVTSLKDASDGLYQAVRPVELQARKDGASRDEAATIGLGELVEGLAPLGIASADDLALATLPAEMAEHAHQSAGLPHRPGAKGPLADLLNTMIDIDAQTDALVAQLDEYAELVEALETSYADAHPAADRLREVAEATAEGSLRQPVVDAARKAAEAQVKRAEAAGHQIELSLDGMMLELAERMGEHANNARDRLGALGESLGTMAVKVRWLRMRIALLRLHNTMVGTFAAELIDGKDLGDSTESMTLLCQALEEGAADLTASDAGVREAADALPGLVSDAVREADRVLRLSTKWRHEAEALGVSDVVAPEREILQAQSEQGFDELRRFYDVAARCALLTDPFDPEALATAIKRMSRAVAAYAAHDAAA